MNRGRAGHHTEPDPDADVVSHTLQVYARMVLWACVSVGMRMRVLRSTDGVKRRVCGRLHMGVGVRVYVCAHPEAEGGPRVDSGRAGHHTEPDPDADVVRATLHVCAWAVCVCACVGMHKGLRGVCAHPSEYACGWVYVWGCVRARVRVRVFALILKQKEAPG